MYQFKEITLKNQAKEKKVLVIEFAKKEMGIVAEFLMTDASLLDYEVLDIIDSVLTSESRQETFSGNRCFLYIKKNTTRIEDLFEDMFEGLDTFPAYEIDTKELRKLIETWKSESAN